MKGQYIVFEGTDGCGKTWQSHRLAEKLTASGAQVIWTREPGGVDSQVLTREGVDIRKFIINARADCAPATLELLLQADRAEHTFRLLEYLQRGFTVISDRSFISGLAYGKANGYPLDRLLAVIDFAVDVLPDYTIFLDCSIETAFARMNGGAGAVSREEVRGPAFMKKVRQNFLDLLFSPIGRDGDVDILRQLDQVCSIRRFSTEHRTKDETSARIDEFLGLG